MRLPALTLIALAALPLFAERRPFEDYRSIVDRQMFGQPPPGFDPSKPPSEVAKIQSAKEMKEKQEQLKSAIHFSAINVASDGEVEVGFTDNSTPGDPKHYFVRKGSMAGKWLVQEADADLATMTLVKDGVSVELTLGEDSAKGAGTTKLIDATVPPASQQPAASDSPRRTLLGGGLLKSSRRRTQDMLEEMMRKRDDDHKREMDEVQQTLRQTLQETKDEIAHNREVAEQAKAELEAANAAKEKAEAELAAAKAAKAESGASEGAGDESNADQ